MVENDDLMLKDSTLTMDQYMSLPFYKMADDVKKKNSRELLAKYGIACRQGHHIHAYNVDNSDNRRSTAAEISIESGSDLYQKSTADFMNRGFTKWEELDLYLMTSRPDFYGNEYFRYRFMMEIYLRRLIAARVAIDVGSERARAGDISAWAQLAFLIQSVYGREQLSVFEEQSSRYN